MRTIKYAIVVLWAVVCAGLLAGNIYYTYKASGEARRVMHMAFAMERDGIIDESSKTCVMRFVKRQHSILEPAKSYHNLERMRYRLQNIRNNYQPKDSGCYAMTNYKQ